MILLFSELQCYSYNVDSGALATCQHLRLPTSQQGHLHSVDHTGAMNALWDPRQSQGGPCCIMLRMRCHLCRMFRNSSIIKITTKFGKSGEMVEQGLKKQ